MRRLKIPKSMYTTLDHNSGHNCVRSRLMHVNPWANLRNGDSLRNLGPLNCVGILLFFLCILTVRDSWVQRIPPRYRGSVFLELWLRVVFITSGLKIDLRHV